MSSLIRAEILHVTHGNIRSRNSIYLVIPLIKSFSEIYDTTFQVYSCVNEDLKIATTSPELEDDCELKYYNIDCYTITYIDTTSNEDKRLIFERYEDAEKFLTELKISIREFYENPEAYVKFIN